MEDITKKSAIVSEKAEEMEKKTDPDLSSSVTQETEESDEEKLNAISVSALDMILKSMSKTTLPFSEDLKLACDEESHESFKDDFASTLRDSFLRELSQTQEEDGVSKCLVTIMKLLPRLNSYFEIYQVAKTDTKFPLETPSYCLNIIANSLREIKYGLKDCSFEDIIKLIVMYNDKGGCGKGRYLQRLIHQLPSVFTIVLEWENNETMNEIRDTVSVLSTEIDLSKIYRYNGDDSSYAKYHLVSMVCMDGDQFNCVAYENHKWIRYFDSDQEEVIGDWENVVNTFTKLSIRPVILFNENAMKRGQLVETPKIL